MYTFEHPQTGETIIVAKADFKDKMTWTQANLACSELGNGWRLPSREELYEMYKSGEALDQLGNMAQPYWSSTDDGEDNHWVQDRPDYGYWADYQGFCWVRAVKSA